MHKLVALLTKRYFLIKEFRKAIVLNATLTLKNYFAKEYVEVKRQLVYAWINKLNK